MKMNNLLLALILVIFFVSISSVSAGFGNDVRGIRDIVSNTNTTPTPEPEPPTNKTNTTEPQTNTTEPQTPEPQTPEYDYDVIPGTNIPAWDIDTSDFDKKVEMLYTYPQLRSFVEVFKMETNTPSSHIKSDIVKRIVQQQTVQNLVRELKLSEDVVSYILGQIYDIVQGTVLTTNDQNII